MDTRNSPQALVVVPDGSTHYLTMPQEDFMDLYAHPIMDDTWIRTHEIVHMSDLVETEGGERIKQEILHEHIQARMKEGEHRQDPILEGMLWQEQFMEDYQQSGERTQDTEQALSYRARMLAQYRARNPNRRGSTAEALEAVLTPSKQAANAAPASASASPGQGASTVAPNTHTSPYESSGRPQSPEELDKADVGEVPAAEGSGAQHASGEREEQAPVATDLDDAQYEELSTPSSRAQGTSAAQLDAPVSHPKESDHTADEIEEL